MKRITWLRRLVYLILLLVTTASLYLAKMWVGVYDHDEFSERYIFIKHRPIWKTYFYSPRGMSDLKLEDMSKEQQHEQKLFDEFVIDGVYKEMKGKRLEI